MWELESGADSRQYLYAVCVGWGCIEYVSDGGKRCHEPWYGLEQGYCD